ncbi:putative acetyltransferase [Aeromonas phage ZPAH34]|uniref:putative acetyltransferase n=1 Tax=Aeromonas phage ZPAH34 TaxID=2924888 RepID=UPI0023297C83|nr:putative acetyltransferase [Aeromonas phage ZPAH34]UOX39511.1 putative acetyltransferase [Aeromonas phage ZPAH34]
MKKLVIAFDKDDTLVNTGAYINEQIKLFFAKNNMAEELEQVSELEHYTSTLNYPPNIKSHIDREIVGPGHFMLYAKPTPIGTRASMRFFQDFKRLYPDHVEYVVCTHRGYHKEGLNYTQRWLKTTMIDYLFDDIHVLDPAKNPNKITFLKEKYPDKEILLLDDNPLGDHHTVHPEMKELVIYNRLNRFPAYQNQYEYKGISDLLELAKKRMGVV